MVNSPNGHQGPTFTSKFLPVFIIVFQHLPRLPSSDYTITHYNGCFDLHPSPCWGMLWPRLGPKQGLLQLFLGPCFQKTSTGATSHHPQATMSTISESRTSLLCSAQNASSDPWLLGLHFYHFASICFDTGSPLKAPKSHVNMCES